MMIDHGVSQQRQVTGWHVLIGFVSFFLLVFAMNAVMIFKAVTTFGGLETDDAYRKGLAYNARIAEAERQEKLGWSVSQVMVGDDKATIAVAISSVDGHPVGGLTLSGQVGRAATDRFDRPVTLTETEPGRYMAQLATPLLGGSWTADLKATGADGTTFQTRRRLWVSP